MKRESLEKYKDESIAVVGRIVEVGGHKRTPTKNYLLLKDVQDVNGHALANHVWISYKNVYGDLGVNRTAFVRGTVDKYGPGDFGIKSYRVEVVK